MSETATLTPDQTTASPMTETRRAQLRAISIFSSLPDADLSCLNDAPRSPPRCGRIHRPAGRDGPLLLDPAHRRNARHHDAARWPRAVTAAPSPRGSSFGELPLLANIPNGADIRAVKPCELLQFDEQQFWNLMTICPGVRKAILGNMAYRFSEGPEHHDPAGEDGLARHPRRRPDA